MRSLSNVLRLVNESFFESVQWTQFERFFDSLNQEQSRLDLLVGQEADEPSTSGTAWAGNIYDFIIWAVL